MLAEITHLSLELSQERLTKRWGVSVDGELASGASGQTLETFALPAEPEAFERVVGVPLRSYASVSVRRQF